MKLLKYSIYAFAFLVLSAASLRAQQRALPLANAGPEAIYVNLGVSLPSGLASAPTSYRVERRSGRSSDWKIIGEVKAPSTEAEFMENLTGAQKQLNHLSLPRQAMITRLWEIAARTGRLDSLGFWGTNPLVQISLGVMYVDNEVTKGTEYDYRVSEVLSGGKSGRAVVSVPLRTPGVPLLAKFTSRESGSDPTGVTLRWTATGTNLPATMTVYRQENVRGDFDLVPATVGFQQSDNTITAIVQDSSTTPAIIVTYYAIPIDLFGNHGIPTDTVRIGMYSFATNSAVTEIRTQNMDSLGGIGIHWKLSAANLVSSIQIQRADKWDGNYATIAEAQASDSTFIDQTTEPMQEYFYRLIATGPLGETSEPSARAYGLFQSAFPPLPPVEVFATGIRNGVRLEWKNPDDHIAGYYVYRVGEEEDSLSLLTTLLPAKSEKMVFVDSSRSLSGKHVYGYSVRSENTSHVQSGFSDTTFARPLIPTVPLAPMEASISLDGTSANIFWMDMTTLDESVQGYVVSRREVLSGKKSTSFTALHDTVLTVNYYRDTTLEIGKKYDYSIQAVDIYGGKSSMTPTAAVSIPIPVPAPPAGVRTYATKSGVTIKWDNPSDTDIVAFRLYRYERGKSPTRLAELKTTGEEFTDSKAAKGKLYFYYLTSINTFGIESSPSNEAGAGR